MWHNHEIFWTNLNQVAIAKKIIKQFSLYVLKMQEEVKWLKDSLKNMLQKDLKFKVQEQNLYPKLIQ